MTGFSLTLETARVGVVGLGYVGLPVAVAFGQQMPTVGIDIKAERVAQLKRGVDETKEATAEELAAATQLSFTTDWADLADCNVFIVTVPTPLNDHNHPDLYPLKSSTTAIGKVLKRGDVVIYESTVYPGCTEEFCVPILEAESGLKFNVDFFCGYSPERINPGDKHRKLPDILKITSGSTPETADFVDAFYRKVVKAGTHRASSIRVAEAAKVMENTQRDLNIALANELAMICNLIGIDTVEVLEAAGTKWNFMPVRPGLVGGHCIGVDPYYLTHKAEEIGHHPEVILAGRRINDRVGKYVVNQFVRLMGRKGLLTGDIRVLVLGFLLLVMMGLNADVMGSYAADPAKSAAHVIALAIAGLAVYAGHAHFIERRAVQELATTRLGREFGIGLLAGAGLYAACEGILMALGIYRIDGLNPLRFLAPAFAMAISSSVFEELLFRGVLYRSVETWFGSWAALVVSSLVFGLTHLMNPQGTLEGADASAVAGVLDLDHRMVQSARPHTERGHGSVRERREGPDHRSGAARGGGRGSHLDALRPARGQDHAHRSPADPCREARAAGRGTRRGPRQGRSRPGRGQQPGLPVRRGRAARMTRRRS